MSMSCSYEIKVILFRGSSIYVVTKHHSDCFPCMNVSLILSTRLMSGSILVGEGSCSTCCTLISATLCSHCN